MASRERLIAEFTQAGKFLKEQIQTNGWRKWSSNYLREHVRSRFGSRFTNSLSPEILDEVARREPELGKYIEASRERF